MSLNYWPLAFKSLRRVSFSKKSSSISFFMESYWAMAILPFSSPFRISTYLSSLIFSLFKNSIWFCSFWTAFSFYSCWNLRFSFSRFWPGWYISWRRRISSSLTLIFWDSSAVKCCSDYSLFCKSRMAWWYVWHLSSAFLTSWAHWLWSTRRLSYTCWPANAAD